MRNDTVADVDREIVGRIARTPLRHEEKVPGAIVCRAGLRTGDKCEQATRGYRISEKLFHHLLQSCGRCFRRSKELVCPSDPTTRRGRPVLGGKGPAAGATAKGGAPRQSTCEAVCLREANWYPTTCVGASEAIQISAICGKCGCHKLARPRVPWLFPRRSLHAGPRCPSRQTPTPGGPHRCARRARVRAAPAPW